MARLLRLVLTLAMAAIIQVSADGSVHSCPLSLASMLETPTCIGLRVQLATTLRTILAPTGDATANVCVDANANVPVHANANVRVDATANVCVDMLRSLFTSPTSLPCTAILTLPSPERRFGWYNYYQYYGPLSGKLRCKFDSAAALNVANLSQEFIVECSEFEKLYDYTWLHQLLGILVGAFWVYWRYGRRPQAIYEAEIAEAMRNNPRPAPMLNDRQRQELIEAGAAPRVNADRSARTEGR